MMLAAGLYQRRQRLDDGGRIGHVLEHFHAGHEIEGRGPLLRQILGGDGAILHGNFCLECMQLGHIEHRLRQIDAEDVRAGTRHRLGQDAAAAADVEHLAAAQRQTRVPRIADATD